MTTAPTVTTANPTLHSNHHYPTSCSFIHHLISASQFSIHRIQFNCLIYWITLCSSPAHTLYLQFRCWLIRCIHFQYLCSFVAYISWWYAFHFYMYWIDIIIPITWFESALSHPLWLQSILVVDVEDTRHRAAFFDGGTVLNVPLFCLPGQFSIVFTWCCWMLCLSSCFNMKMYR